MAVFKRGNIWWYKFRFSNREIRESAKTQLKTLAKQAEQKRRRELEEGYNDVGDRRSERIQSLTKVADEYLADYALRHRSVTFARYAIGHVKRHLGEKLVVDLGDQTVRSYQATRLKEGASPKSINEEVGFLLRLLKERGDGIRVKLRRDKALKLKIPQNVAKAYDPEHKAALLDGAAKGHRPSGEKATPQNSVTRSPFIKPALALAFSAGMRDAEIRNLRWGQIDFAGKFLTVGRSKTDAGEGRTIPLNSELFTALNDHLAWYTNKFGKPKSHWYIFPGRAGKPSQGKKRPYDTERPTSSFKTAWRNLKERVGVEGRFHDTRHTLITELAESGAGDQTIMDIAGHVSRQMLGRYSHIRMEAKRKALEAVTAKAKPASTAHTAGKTETAGEAKKGTAGEF
jgi:integrase